MDEFEQDAGPDRTGERAELTPWDARVVRSILTANSARTGALVLRIAAACIAAVTIAGNLLYILSIDSEFEGSAIATRLKVATFLREVASPLAFAGLVLAASYLVAVYAARLDLDIVQGDDDEFDREQRQAT